MEYLWVLGIAELQLVFFEVATDGSFSAAHVARSQAVLHRDGARGCAVSGAIVLQGRRKSVFAGSVHAPRIGCVRQIWTELELYCCCGTATLEELFGFFFNCISWQKKMSKWRNCILKYQRWDPGPRNVLGLMF